MNRVYGKTGEDKGCDQAKRERTSFREGHRHATSVSIYDPRILNLFLPAVNREGARAREARVKFHEGGRREPPTSKFAEAPKARNKVARGCALRAYTWPPSGRAYG